jgi:hypothetical protein
MADVISWSIILGSGTLSSLLRIRLLPTTLEPVVRGADGLSVFFWFRCGTISHGLVGDSPADITPSADYVVFGVRGGAALSGGAGFGFGV